MDIILINLLLVKMFIEFPFYSTYNKYKMKRFFNIDHMIVLSEVLLETRDSYGTYGTVSIYGSEARIRGSEPCTTIKLKEKAKNNGSYNEGIDDVTFLRIQ
jgi:hypothetical protein